jgi:Flp pilus assembly protein TadB
VTTWPLVFLAASAVAAALAVWLWGSIPLSAGRAGARTRPGGEDERDGKGDGTGEHAETTAHDVADALVLLAVALRSGIGQSEALECVARRTDGKVREQLGAVAAALRWGRDGSEAWGHATDVWRPAALAWQVAVASGAGPAELIEESAQRIREHEDRRIESAIARAGVLLVLPLGLAFLPSFACTTVIPVVLALARTVLGP